ncbi:MAG: chromosome segregation protein SMC [Nitrospirae bacterium]|nr:chromosome segregation protein SMC [Nitrospirota bacterium]
MQLKSLDMLGFKSFFEKTTLHFQPGVTAVVGPNGCGKSNISDAIRWVLGEQSAKHLRGDKMEDVIFSGSESRKPLGLAEVTLTLANVSGLPSEFGQYSEIEITRRLYRSGESEYLINKIPCRLKDIRDLMMDAGVGAKLHAIIEQDRVKKIIESKPEDRRFLFEEVAGVMKYKARRQEALSKLESTQQNQLRVNDILTEVKRQVNSLDRQAKKAERYQKLRAEMKDLELRLASVEYANLGGEWTTSTGEFKDAEDEVTGLHASLSTIESAIEETRAEALSSERELALLQHQVHEIENALRQAEHRVEMSRTQIAALTEQRGRDLKDIEYLSQESERNAEQKKRFDEESGSITATLASQNAILLERTTAFEEFARSLKGREAALEAARAGVYTAMTDAAAEKARIANLEIRIHQLDEMDGRSQDEVDELAKKLEGLKVLLGQKEQEIGAIASRRSGLQEEHARVTARLEAAVTRKKELDAELGATKNRLAGQSSRLHSLIELEQSLEGYQKGVQTVMAAKKQTSAERVGTIHGLVADIIETEPKYETAIEAVLGDRLQNVVVGSQNDSLKAIEYLKSSGGGRSTFIPETPRSIPTEPFVKNGHAGVIGNALGVVRCKDDYKNVAQYLLGDVVVVDTMDTALYLWHKNGIHKTIVTLTGEIVDPWGAVTGGAAEAGGSGMLRKRREIKDLESEVAALGARITGLEQDVHALEASIKADTRAEAELSDEVHKAELELLHQEKDAAALRDEANRSSARANTLAAERAERAARRRSFRTEIDRSSAMLRDLEDGHSSAQASIETLQRELSSERENLETARAGITDIRMAVAALQEKQAAAAKGAEALELAGVDLAERLRKREAEIGEIAGKVRELEAAITAAEEEIRGHITALEREREALNLRQEAHAEKTSALGSHEEEARQVRHDIDAAQKRLSGIEVRRTELRMKIEHLKDNIWTGYHTELEAVVQELGQFEIDLDASKHRVSELREKIDQMGPINVDALQEYNELKERYDVLSAQQQDISESIANLKATIAKLDVETIELFTQSFAAIQQKFREVFTRLFEGGRADVILLDPANVLESGIEIVAQPRGKKVQSITSLSGGEKALTAIALLFAAFLVKPSPFCMLDEADAPLDASNVMRFTRLIREMSDRSQFIVITHKTGTMEMADALYGITMDEPGCSKVVSVKLREAAMA